MVTITVLVWVTLRAIVRGTVMAVAIVAGTVMAVVLMAWVRGTVAVKMTITSMLRHGQRETENRVRGIYRGRGQLWGVAGSQGGECLCRGRLTCSRSSRPPRST